MKLKQIASIGKFYDIFERHSENGKVKWIELLREEKQLPTAFIDEYFNVLKNYRIESLMALPEEIIELHANGLNWYALLQHTKVSTEILEKNFTLIDKPNTWRVVLRFQKPTLQFLEDHSDKWCSLPNIGICIRSNVSFTEEEKKQLLRFVVDREDSLN